MNSTSLCSLAGRYENPTPTRFLAPHRLFKNSSSVQSDDKPVLLFAQAQISHWEENLEEHIIIALVDYYLPRINRFCCLRRRRSAPGRRTWSGCRWSSSGCAATWPPYRPGSCPTPRSKSTFLYLFSVSVEQC